MIKNLSKKVAVFKSKILKHDVIRNVSGVMIGTLLAQLIPLLLQPFLKRMYTPEEFGVFEVYFRLFSIVAVLITLRYEKAIVIAETREKSFNLLVVTLFISIIFVFLIEVFLIFNYEWVIDILHFPKKYGYVLILLPFSAFFFIGMNATSLFLLREKLFFKSSSLKVYKRFTEGSLQILLFRNFLSKGLFIADLLGNMIGFIIGIFKVKKFDLKVKYLSKSLTKSLLAKYSDFPKYNLIANLLNTFVMGALTLQVYSKFSIEDVGFLELTQKILVIPTALIGMAIAQVILQKVSESKEKNRSILKDMKILLIVSSLFIIIYGSIIFLFGEYIFEILFGAKWVTSAIYAKILLIGMGFAFVVSPMGQVLIGLGKIKKNAFWEYIKFIIIGSLFFVKFDSIENYLITYNYLLFTVYVLYSIIIIVEIKRYEKNILKY